MKYLLFNHTRTQAISYLNTPISPIPPMHPFIHPSLPPSHPPTPSYNILIPHTIPFPQHSFSPLPPSPIPSISSLSYPLPSPPSLLTLPPSLPPSFLLAKKALHAAEMVSLGRRAGLLVVEGGREGGKVGKVVVFVGLFLSVISGN